MKRPLPKARLLAVFLFLMLSYVPLKAQLSFSSTSSYQFYSEVYRPLPDQEVMEVRIVVSGTGGTLDANNFIFSTTGTTSAADLVNARLYYSGNSALFATSTQVGNTISSPNGPFTIFTTGGGIPLQSGTNYFWLTYQVSATATLGNSVDATFSSVVVGGIQRFPAVSAPPQKKTIAPPTTTFQMAGTANSALGRAPGTQFTFNRSASIYTAAELSFLPVGTSVKTLGFYIITLGTTQVEVSGNIKIYVQNTTDASFQKSTTWSTLITGMTMVYNGPLIIEPRLGGYEVRLNTPFTLTGSNMYVAFDWEITSPNPVPTVATQNAFYYCNNAAVGGDNGNRTGTSTTTTVPATLGTSSAFRPVLRLGKDAQMNEVEVTTIYSLDDLANPAGNPHQVKAIVKNNGAMPIANYPVHLNVSGANSFSDVKTVSLNFGQSGLVTFSSFNSPNNGTNNIQVSVGPDDDNTNNSKTLLQNVNPSLFSYGKGPAIGGVGYNTGSGFLLNRYFANGPWYVDSVYVHIADNSASVGNSVYAAVLDAAGNILATSNPVTLTSGDLNTQMLFKINNPLFVYNEHFYVGLAQTANAVTGYYPMGTVPETPTRDSAYYGLAGLTGGGIPTNYTTLGKFLLDAVVKTSPPPFMVSLGADTTYCQGDSVFLNAGITGQSYLWSNGSTTQSIYAKTPGTYWVKVTNSQRYPVFDTINIIEYPMYTPEVLLTSSHSNSICDGEMVTFTASPSHAGSNPGFYWVLNGDTITGNNSLSFSTNSLVNGDIVQFQMTSSEICVTQRDVSSTAFNMVVLPLPQVIAGQDITVCEGEYIVLSSSGNGNSCQWNNGIPDNVPFKPTYSGTYVVTCTHANGCTNSDSLVITVDELPVVLAGNDTTICERNEITLTGMGNAVGYSWNNGVVDGISFAPTATTTYTVTGMAANGCSKTDDIKVTVNAVPLVSLKPFDLVCVNHPGFYLSGGSPPGGNYTYPGATSTYFNPATMGAGDYPVTYIITTAQACKDSASTILAVGLCSGIETSKQGKQELRVYPNPASNAFVVDITSAMNEEAFVNIIGFNGQVVYSKHFSLTEGPNLLNINSQDFARGVYNIQVTTSDRQINKKVILQ